MEATNYETEENLSNQPPQKSLTTPRPRTRQNCSPEQSEQPESQRGYRHAIDEFVDWYCSKPRLAFNRIVERLHAKGYISNRKSRAKSLVFSEGGER
jgi:hypothetical protein